MHSVARGTVVGLALAIAWVAPASAVDERRVAPDGRAMAEQSFSSLVPEDTDSVSDVYSWNRGVFSLASPGPSSHAYGAMAKFISDDGTRVVFETWDPMLSSDTDTALDVYETVGGVTSLVSTGPSDAGTPDDARFAGASEDGTRLFFETIAQLVPEDTDSSQDIYLRSGGVTTLFSTSPAGSPGGHRAVVAVSRNGERVVESTHEPLLPEDTDSAGDLYEHFGGETKLISKGPVADSTPDTMLTRDVTPDAKSIVVITEERFTSGDKNEDWDLYQFSRGRTTLVTSRSDGVSPECGNPTVDRAKWALGLDTPPRRPPCEPFVAGQTDTGSRVLFSSSKPLDAEPGTLLQPSQDTTGGLFEKSSDGTTRLIDEEGTGTYSAIAADGSRYVVYTSAQRTAGDTDDMADLYLVEGGSSTLLSGGGTGETLPHTRAVSTDARRVFFDTTESLAPEDDNDDENVYVNTDAGPRLALTGPADSDPAGLGAFVGASALGDRWFFFTARPLVAEDTDAEVDFYIRHLDGTTRKLSP